MLYQRVVKMTQEQGFVCHKCGLLDHKSDQHYCPRTPEEWARIAEMESYREVDSRYDTEEVIKAITLAQAQARRHAIEDVLKIVKNKTVIDFQEMKSEALIYGGTTREITGISFEEIRALLDDKKQPGYIGDINGPGCDPEVI